MSARETTTTSKHRSLGDRIVLAVAWAAAQEKDLDRAEEIVSDLIGDSPAQAADAILGALEEPWLAPYRNSTTTCTIKKEK